MVYKIQGNFNENNFNTILEKIKKFYLFIFSNGNLYVALNDYNLNNQAYKELTKALKPKNEFLVLKIDEKNIMNEAPDIKDWLRNNLVRLDRQKFEAENQEKLKAYNSVLDEFERILKQEWINTKVGHDTEITLKENDKNMTMNGNGNVQVSKDLT